MNKENRKKVCSPKGCAVFSILIVLTFNCLFLTLMISKSIVINQENQILLQRILALNSTSKNSNNDDVIKVKVDGDGLPVINDTNEMPPQSPEKLVQLLHSVKECQPCHCPTTPKPDPIDGHLNPVGILNEVTQFMATYDCIHSCVHPVIHTAYLTIEDEDYAGLSWTGIGKSKAMSKHAAAYKVLQERFPDKAATIPPQNIPPVYNPEPCQKPTENLLESRSKC